MQKIVILSNELISETSAILKFKRNWDFIAGQVVNITTDINIPPRIYSICSAENENEVSILYNILPSGKLTPILSKLKIGDPIFVSEPTGRFFITPDPAWLIATGTGIAPYISMIKSGYSEINKLIHGSKSISDLYFREYLQQKLGSNYIPCVPISDFDNVYKGRVTSYILNNTNLPENNKYYLCGRAEMIVETRDLLISKGILFQNIQSEIYF